MGKTWSDHIVDFMEHLELDESILPHGILPLYPMKGENSVIAKRVVHEFYQKYYADDHKRRLLIGINPGRLGAGATGIPFSDTKRLREFCDIEISEFHTHEPSSVFIYDMIQAYGGPSSFYSSYYITSVCPIGFVEQRENNRVLNYNYYDSKALTVSIEQYIIDKLKVQLSFGADRSEAFCLGTGKNFKYLNDLNKRIGLFDKVTPLEHPRYIMQYKNKSKQIYIDKYLSAFASEFF